METRIQRAETLQQAEDCFAVMAELRPHLGQAEFLSRIDRQRQAGYRLAFLEADGEVRAVAGFRVGECLAWGRFLYVDDLVTRSSDRSRGFGGELLDWLVEEARRCGCSQVHLDSGVQRFGAHRFYLMRGMNITSHHFALVLDGS